MNFQRFPSLWPKTLEHKTSALPSDKNEIFYLTDSWWLWKWLLTSGLTKRLFNLDLEYGVFCDQRASQPQFWWKVTKGLLNLETGAEMLIKWLLYLNLDERKPKGFSTLELEERRSKGFSTLKPELECWSKDFSASILM